MRALKIAALRLCRRLLVIELGLWSSQMGEGDKRSLRLENMIYGIGKEISKCRNGK